MLSFLSDASSLLCFFFLARHLQTHPVGRIANVLNYISEQYNVAQTCCETVCMIFQVTG